MTHRLPNLWYITGLGSIKSSTDRNATWFGFMDRKSIDSIYPDRLPKLTHALPNECPS